MPGMILVQSNIYLIITICYDYVRLALKEGKGA
jgi:hypothetical protein